MENKKVKSSASSSSKKSHATVFGFLIFTVFNLIFLSLLSWILLVGWFSVQSRGGVTDIIIGTLKITLSRGHVFLESFPFIGAILFVLMIDGLVQRDIRKFQAARESTFIFHRLKPLAAISFYILFFIYMANPYSLPADVFLVPMAALSGLFAMLSIKSFKKYM